MQINCPFCQKESLAPYTLFKTEHFLTSCDYAPVAEGHLLLVPKEHYCCYAALPRRLSGELAEVKKRVTSFLRDCFAEPLFFEHGVAGQTVPHAHLHAVPLPQERRRHGAAKTALRSAGKVEESPGLDALLGTFDDMGPYLYWEETGKSCIVRGPVVQPGFLQELVAGWTGRTGLAERRYTGAKEFRSIKEKWEDRASKRPERSNL